MKTRKTNSLADHLADPDTGRRIAFPRMPLRLTYDDIMGQNTVTTPGIAPEYVMVTSRRRLQKAQDQNESSRQI